MKTKSELIRDYLGNLLVNEIEPLYVRYCEAANIEHEDVYKMNEFNGVFDDYPPMYVAKAVFESEEFSPDDLYFWQDADGNLHSFNLVESLCAPYDTDAISEYCDEYGDDLGDPYIRKIISGTER